jgi:hypothetical protein
LGEKVEEAERKRHEEEVADAVLPEASPLTGRGRACRQMARARAREFELELGLHSTRTRVHTVCTFCESTRICQPSGIFWPDLDLPTSFSSTNKEIRLLKVRGELSHRLLPIYQSLGRLPVAE